MKKIKIYLSPAAHAYDHRCSYGGGCTENTHSNMFMDYIEKYLKASGFDVKRKDIRMVGDDGMIKCVEESNKWGANLHYVVHTNASNGTVQGSRPMYYPSGDGKKICATIKKYREMIYPYHVSPRANTSLYEIRMTKAVAVYEELVFHDNAVDAKWLHDNMRLMAEYTVLALCDYYGVEFVNPFIKKGDVNNDGKVNTTDARIILQHAAGKRNLSGTEKLAGDYNGDGSVDTSDARQILKNSVEK